MEGVLLQHLVMVHMGLITGELLGERLLHHLVVKALRIDHQQIDLSHPLQQLLKAGALHLVLPQVVGNDARKTVFRVGPAQHFGASVATSRHLGDRSTSIEQVACLK